MKRYQIERAREKTKKKVRRIGSRSICDIIHDKPIPLSFEEKVNYIRHVFTYYDGCYELFKDENGKPNERKQRLNDLISDVINQEKGPEVLKEFNKKLIRWRRIKDIRNKRLEKEKQDAEEKDYKLHDWYKMTKANHYHKDFKMWKQLIIEFIHSPANNLSNEFLKHIRFKQLKRIVNIWVSNGYKCEDYNGMLHERFPIEKLVYRVNK